MSGNAFVKSVSGVWRCCEEAWKILDSDAGLELSVAEQKEEKAEEEEEDMDLFGDDDDDDEASFEALCKAKQAAIDKANSKKKAIAKSIILWEVKPLDSETDLDAVAVRIKKIVQDGLNWKEEHKKEPVAFGIMKLIIGAVIEDAKVSTDDI